MGGYLDLYDLTDFFHHGSPVMLRSKTEWGLLGGFVVQKKSGQWEDSGMSHYANTHQVLGR